MTALEEIVNSLDYPIPIPEDAFFSNAGQDYLVAFDKVFTNVPQELSQQVDLNGTSSRIDNETYQFRLQRGSYITIKIQNRAIVGILLDL